jgi:hypothetical protein
MSLKVVLAVAAVFGLTSESAWGAQPSVETASSGALSQCVALRTTGADRIVTARWLFAVMTKSPQIADLSAVTTGQRKVADQDFARLLTRLITKDCINEVRPIAASSGTKDAFGQVGRALGETAMNELMSGNEVDKGLEAYTEYLSEEDFKSLTDSLPKKTK